MFDILYVQAAAQANTRVPLRTICVCFGDQCGDSNQHFAHDHCMSSSHSGSIAGGCCYVSDMFEIFISFHVAHGIMEHTFVLVAIRSIVSNCV